MKIIKTILILMLMLICLFVMILQLNGSNAWKLIYYYWFLLLIKNGIDLIEEV